MVTLIIYHANPHREETSFAGLPLIDQHAPFTWPTCNACHLPMQHLGKIATDLGYEQLFMCQNDPGVCSEWDADMGANCVIITPSSDSLMPLSPPDSGEALRQGNPYGTRLVTIDAENYSDAIRLWKKDNNTDSARLVLGQLYGEPEWLQNDETPTCNHCKKNMRFVAQLEAGPDYKTEMNFGGGCAYVFDCGCKNTAKFLWQC